MSTAVEAAEQLQAAYDNLCRIFGLLETAEIEKGQMVDGWSPKALMAHIAFWDDYQTARMKAAIQGESAPLGFARPSADNDERALVDNERTWDLILAEADAARQKMVDFARTLDNEHFTAHYPEANAPYQLPACSNIWCATLGSIPKISIATVAQCSVGRARTSAHSSSNSIPI
ncbi:MAG: DinB family protein [Caldilineaceae bacterium]